MSNSKSVKLWIGIELDSSLFDDVVSHLTEVEVSEHYHITLKYLGECHRNELSSIISHLSSFKHSAFQLSFGSQLSVFNQKVAYIPLACKELLLLQQKIDKSLRELFLPEKNYIPHVTIAKSKTKISELPSVVFFIPPVRILCFTLFETVVIDEETEYRVRKKFYM